MHTDSGFASHCDEESSAFTTVIDYIQGLRCGPWPLLRATHNVPYTIEDCQISDRGDDQGLKTCNVGALRVNRHYRKLSERGDMQRETARVHCH